MSRRRLDHLSLISALIALQCSVVEPGQSQESTSAPGAALPQETKIPKIPWAQNKKENDFSQPQPLRDQPELPQLPSYSGKSRFLAGHVQSNPEGWIVYSVKYETKEPAQDVRDWYQNAFNMYQWNTTQSGGTVVGAEQKNGNTCSVRVQPTRDPVYLSKVELSYTVAPEGLVPKENP